MNKITKKKLYVFFKTFLKCRIYLQHHVGEQREYESTNTELRGEEVTKDEPGQ